MYRHNERRNKNYSNANIDKEKSYLNYSIKSPQYSYEKEFDKIKEKYNLKGQIKTVSNIACEYIITSDKEFFERTGEAAFYNYMVFNNFELERGLPKEETEREHIDLKEYKETTNFDKTKEKLQNLKLELPDVPDLEDINVNRLSKKRDEKIMEEIIKPQDDLINELYKNNLSMHQELLRQAKMVEKAEKYENERDKILSDNRELHNQVDNIKAEYKEKEFDLEWKYKSKIKSLEKENNHLHRIIDKFKESIGKFIEWIYQKFDMGAEDNLIRKFEKETRTYLDAEKQIKQEEKEKEWKIEI